MSYNQRILVALSQTESDIALLKYARLVVDTGCAREIRFVHVQSAVHWGHGAPAVAVSIPDVEQAVERHFGQIPAGVIASCHVEHGERVDALIEAATRLRTDIILLGHRRNRTGQRSLSRRLVMIAPSSVWMVPEGAPNSIRRILAPVDFSEHSADSLAVAASIAKVAEADECLALHVFFRDSTVLYPEQGEAYRLAQQREFDRFMETANAADFAVDRRLEEGPEPSKTILRIANNQESDLIVMNTRGRSRAAAVLLGSVTTQVIVETPIAILAVKHFGAMMGLFQALKDVHLLQRHNLKSN
jgi:sulfate permease, SulP family